MLCRHCRSPLELSGRPTSAVGARTEPGADRLRALMCSNCGVLLPSRDPLEALLAKLAQLARFGLDAEGRPLLTPAPRDG